ncbi:MAG: DnaB-like helicase N-terminal domain-containing protein [Bryobacteraceae bacterium]
MPSRSRKTPPLPELPCNVDAERMILGQVLLDSPTHLAAVRGQLQTDDFSLEKHRRIYRAMCALGDRGLIADRFTVANELHGRGELESCDGVSYLAELDAYTPGLPNLDGYLRIVSEKASLRRVIIGADALHKRAMLQTESVESLAKIADGIAEDVALLGNKTKRLVFSYQDVPSVWDYESEVSYIIPDLVPEGGITLITGDSGSGKTILVTAMAGAIVSGGCFLNRAAKQRKVLYLDRENPLALAKQHLFDLHIRRTPDLIMWGGWCDQPPDGPASVSLLEFARAEKPVLIFDSLIAFHNGDEQDASETRRYLQYFRNLAAAGASIIVLHHTGKGENAKQYRGSTDIKASVDMAWLLEKLGDPAGLLSELRLVPFKNRIGTCNTMQLSFRDGEFKTDQRPESNREIFERIVRLHPNATGTAIQQLGMAAGLAKHRIAEFLLDGVEKGWLTVRSGKGAAKHYSLSEVTLGEI